MGWWPRVVALEALLTIFNHRVKTSMGGATPCELYIPSVGPLFTIMLGLHATSFLLLCKWNRGIEHPKQTLFVWLIAAVALCTWLYGAGFAPLLSASACPVLYKGHMPWIIGSYFALIIWGAGRYEQRTPVTERKWVYLLVWACLGAVWYLLKDLLLPLLLWLMLKLLDPRVWAVLKSGRHVGLAELLEILLEFHFPPGSAIPEAGKAERL